MVRPMSDILTHSAPLTRWQGDKAVYHLLRIEGGTAEAIAMHARLQRLEFGKRRGFGSVKVMARIGETKWKTSVFPQDKSASWILLVGKKVIRAEDLAPGDPVSVELELL